MASGTLRCMSEPSPSQPEWGAAPPQQPAPTPPASTRRGNNDLAAPVFGPIILGVGVYFLLRETLNIAIPTSASCGRSS
jgi:hypothetical protein